MVCAVLGAARPSIAAGWLFVRGAEEEQGSEGGVGMVLDGTGSGVVVARVVPGGPAARAGVRGGDRVLGIGGETLASGAPLASVVAKVRGKVGTRLHMEVLSAGAAASRRVEIDRAPLKSLFPARAPQPLRVEPSLALLAVGEGHQYGMRFVAAAGIGQEVRYEWVVAPTGVPLADEARTETGRGLVRPTEGGATIQIGEWRLDLEPWPERGVQVVARSNLPLAPVEAADFRRLDPAVAAFVLPRATPKQDGGRWSTGPCKLTVTPRVGGALRPQHRLTLELADATGATQPSRPLRTDERGEVTLQLPAGSWTVTKVLETQSGGGPDLAFAGRLVAPVSGSDCRAGTPTRVELDMSASPADAGPLPATIRDHALVGKPMPAIGVRQWLGGTAMPKDGRALLIFAWATWCGPCKRTLPTIVELAARLASRGLRVVLASADRDEAAIRDAVDDMMPGGPALAWVGTELLDVLDMRGIPTTVLVDGQGVIRALHTGTTASPAAWEAELAPLLQGDAPTTVNPPPVMGRSGKPAGKR